MRKLPYYHARAVQYRIDRTFHGSRAFEYHANYVLTELAAARSLEINSEFLDIINSISISMSWGLPLWEISNDNRNFWPHDSHMQLQSAAFKIRATGGRRLAEAAGFIDKARKFFDMYNVFCVPNFVDELISYVLPEYVIGGTYEAYMSASTLRRETLNTINSKAVDEAHKIATFIASICVGAVYPETKYVEKIKADIMTLGREAARDLFNLCLDQLFLTNTKPLQPMLAAMFNYTIDANHSARFGVWQKLFEVPSNTIRGPKWVGMLDNGCCEICVNLCVEQLANQLRAKGHIASDRLHLDPFWVKMTSLVNSDVTTFRQQYHPKCLINFTRVITKFNELVPGVFGLTCLDADTKALWVVHFMYGAPLPKAMRSGKRHYSNIRFSDLLTTGVDLYYTKHKAAYKILDRIYPCSSTTDSTHMVLKLSHLVYSMLTLQHNLRAGDTIVGMDRPVPRTTRSGMLKIINHVLKMCPVGTVQNIIITLLILYMDANDSEKRHLDAICCKLFRHSTEKQMQILKNVSVLLRRYNMNILGEEVDDTFVAKLSYLELSYGRSCFLSNYEAEIKNRTEKTYHLWAPESVVNNPKVNVNWRENTVAYDNEDGKFYDELQVEVSKIIKQICGHRTTKLSYEDFLTKANDWLASGSAPKATAYLAVPNKDGTSSVSKVKVGKRGWAENLNTHTFSRRIYLKTPIEEAVASEKFENGKGRALYGVEPEHYMHSTYATKGLEENLYRCPGLEKGLRGLAALNMETFRCQLTLSPKIHCMMLDYADFNVQHSPRSQAIIFEEIAKHHESVGSSRDIIQANRWVAKAKYNMKCTFHAGGQPYKNVVTGSPLITPRHTGRTKHGEKQRALRVVQGMFSGTRSTDLINTILNLAYFRVAHNYVTGRLGIDASALYHTHQGDDVWLSSANVGYCALLYYTINKMGLVTQKHKQMFGAHRGEYLRVLYTNGKATGYLGRAIANFVLKEIQRPLPMDSAANLKMAWDSLNTMARRGIGPLAYTVLWYDQLDHWSKVFEFPGDPKPVTIPRSITTTPTEGGGLGYLWPSITNISKITYCIMGSADASGKYSHWNKSIKLPVPTITVPANAISDSTPRRCTNNWISNLSKDLYQHGNIRAEALRKANLCSNYADAIATHWRRSMLRKYKKDMRVWIEKVGSGEGLRRIQHDIQDADVSKPHSIVGYYCDNRHDVLSRLLHITETTTSLKFTQQQQHSDMSLAGRYLDLHNAWAPTNAVDVRNNSVMMHWQVAAPNAILQGDAFMNGPQHTTLHLYNDHYATVSQLTDVPDTASSILNQVIVRSTTKCLPVLQSALNLTKYETFALLVHKANGFSEDITNLLHRWLHTMHRGNLHLLDIITQSSIRLLGSLDTCIQPSLTLTAYASGTQLYTTTTMTDLPDDNLTLASTCMLLPTLLLIGRLMRRHIMAGIKVAY